MRHNKLIKIASICLSLVAGINCLAVATPAQSNGNNHARTLRGYSDSNRKAQIDWEEKMRALPKPEILREYMQRLSAEPHHVGSAYDKQNAEYMLEKFRSWGLEAKIEEFDVLFPTPKERVLEMIEPVRFRAQLKEPPLAEDPDSNDANQLPTYNAFSADGDVTGHLVYVNYGVPADYDELEEDGRRCERQDSHRALRRELARHQAEGRLRERRYRLFDLFRPARRRLLSGRRLPGRPLSARTGRAARLCDGHADSSGRPAHAGLGRCERRTSPPA